jgi:Peptidyl-tRNA hydrolase PTH2
MELPVQYVLIRNDLEGYGTGALVAQGVHAAILALVCFGECSESVEYTGNPLGMHTVVLQCSLNEMRKVMEVLKEGKDFCRWVEEPEGKLTALGFKPLYRSRSKDVTACLRKLKLF